MSCRIFLILIYAQENVFILAILTKGYPIKATDEILVIQLINELFVVTVYILDLIVDILFGEVKASKAILF